MLQKIRDHAHGWWAYVLVPILVLLFGLWGIGNYLTGSLSRADIASVNGASISINNFSILYQQVNQQQNPSQNPALSRMLKIQVLQNLVNQELFYQVLKSLGFAVSPDIIDESIYQIPAFQVQGRFSMAQYQAILQSLDETTESLRNDLTKSYLTQQFQQGLLASQFVLPTEIAHETKLANLVRDVHYLVIDPSAFSHKVVVVDAAVAQYYQNYKNQFMTPYQVKLQYIILSAAQFSQGDKNQTQAAFQNALTSLSNVAFQNPNSLMPAAMMLHVPVQTTGWLDMAGQQGLFANPQVIAAVKSDSVLNQGNNSSVLTLNDHQVMVVRVLDKKMPEQLSFSQVAPQIKALLVKQQELLLAQQTAQEIQNALNVGTSFADVAGRYHLPMQSALALRADNKNISKSLLVAALQAPVGGGVLLPADGKFIVLQVAKIYLPPNLKVQLSPQALQNLWSQIELGSFLGHLQAGAHIKINNAILN
jgi:hypothetical protein